MGRFEEYALLVEVWLGYGHVVAFVAVAVLLAARRGPHQLASEPVGPYARRPASSARHLADHAPDGGHYDLGIVL